MFNSIKQQNNSTSKSGIATSGNDNKIQQNNTMESKSTFWKWFIGTFIALSGVIISLLKYLK
ncbi:MAG: hypothetical protein ACJA02_001243 [Myxococcota bacterium]|jgi:hypothetical protein